MKRKLLRLSAWMAVVPLTVSCNIYSPFETDSSVQDHLEAARKCEHQNDYDCAVTEYAKLPAGELQEEKLCLANLGRAGFTLTTLINTFKTQTVSVLGSIANQLLPYTDDKGAAVVEAKTHCFNYMTLAAASDPKLAALLNTLGAFVHCATMMAKTTAYAATGSTDCNARNTVLTAVTKTSIAANASGSVNNSAPGMCRLDALSCVDDFGKIDAASLQNAQLTDVFSTYNQLKNDPNTKPLFQNSGDDTLARKALMTTVGN